MKTPSRLTTKRIANGEFETFFDGIKTHYTIHNGSNGLSGRGRNVYGISNNQTGKLTWLGPLRTCKSAIEHTMTKKADLSPSAPLPSYRD